MARWAHPLRRTLAAKAGTRIQRVNYALAPTTHSNAAERFLQVAGGRGRPELEGGCGHLTVRTRAGCRRIACASADIHEAFEKFLELIARLDIFFGTLARE